MFEDIQAIITDADNSIVAGCDAVSTRDKFWRDLSVAQVAVSNKILGEEIEIAYAALCGYDARVRGLFLESIGRLKHIRQATESHLFESTQGDILGFQEAKPASVHLGNRLRATCAEIADDYVKEMSNVFTPFRDELLKIIEADDSAIVRKDIPLKKAQDMRLYQGYTQELQSEN